MCVCVYICIHTIHTHKYIFFNFFSIVLLGVASYCVRVHVLYMSMYVCIHIYTHTHIYYTYIFVIPVARDRRHRVRRASHSSETRARGRLSPRTLPSCPSTCAISASQPSPLPARRAKTLGTHLRPLPRACFQPRSPAKADRSARLKKNKYLADSLLMMCVRASDSLFMACSRAHPPTHPHAHIFTLKSVLLYIHPGKSHAVVVS